MVLKHVSKTLDDIITNEMVEWLSQMLLSCILDSMFEHHRCVLGRQLIRGWDLRHEQHDMGTWTLVLESSTTAAQNPPPWCWAASRICKADTNEWIKASARQTTDFRSWYAIGGNSERQFAKICCSEFRLGLVSKLAIATLVSYSLLI